MLKSWWLIFFLASAKSRDDRGILLIVEHPVANVTYEKLPVTVSVRLKVTEGEEAAWLRNDPGLYEVCYGIKGGTEKITCLGVGDPVVVELPEIEAAHLATSSRRLSSEEVANTFVAWVQRNGFRVYTTSVLFKTLIEPVDAFEKAASIYDEKTSREESSTKGNDHENDDRDAEFVRESSVQFEQGFVVIPSLVQRERALNIAGFLDEHVSVHGERYANMQSGVNMGGWFIADCFRVPELAHLLDVVTADRRLIDFLAAQLGEDFHLLERSEVYIGRHVGWHSDVMYGPLKMYEAHLDGTSYRDGRHWGTKPDDNYQTDRFEATGSKIFTVAVYFRDHHEDDKGLTVIPYTHSNVSEWERAEGDKEQSGVHVSTRAGDAVVFDSRLLHKGLDKSLADFIRKPGTAHRSLLSISFGRRDPISEAFSRGFGFRTQLHHFKSSICPNRDKYGDANINWQCVYDAVRLDLVRRPMKGVPCGVPWLQRRREALLDSPAVNSVADTDINFSSCDEANFEVGAVNMPLLLHGSQPMFKLSTGALMPATAFGTAFRTASQVQAALKSGFRHLDLSEMYGNEIELGGLFRQLGWDRGGGGSSLEHSLAARSDVFITSKVWATNLGAVREALENTLAATSLPWLDLYLIHWPVALASVGVTGPSQGIYWPVDGSGTVVYALDGSTDGDFGNSLLMSAWGELERAFDGGKVKAIGVGNMPEVLLDLLWQHARVKPHVHQFEAHPQLPQVELLQYCLKYAIAPMAHSALGGGGGGFGTLASDVASREVITKATELRTGGADPPSFAQTLVQWALHRKCGVVVSSGTDTHSRELFEATMAMSTTSSSRVRASEASFNLLSGIPVSRHHRRHAPPPFAHLFEEPLVFKSYRQTRPT